MTVYFISLALRAHKIALLVGEWALFHWLQSETRDAAEGLKLAEGIRFIFIVSDEETRQP